MKIQHFSRLFLLVTLLILVACSQNNNSATGETTSTPPAEPAPTEPAPTDNGVISNDTRDLMAISQTIHGFYKWYGAFLEDETKDTNFTNDKGKYLTLDKVKLQQYFNYLRESGALSETYFKNEQMQLEKCELLWKEEGKDGPPSCLDYDRIFCAQDWDINFWTSAPVVVEGLGSDKVMATLSDKEVTAVGGQRFSLQKENGKWMIAAIICE
jgi:Protein of unknown function (DUF3828)